jgi:hypothetical protein
MLPDKGIPLSLPLFSQHLLPPKLREDKSPSETEGLLSLALRDSHSRDFFIDQANALKQQLSRMLLIAIKSSFFY